MTLIYPRLPEPSFAADDCIVEWRGSDGCPLTSSGAVPLGKNLTITLSFPRYAALASAPVIDFRRDSDGSSFSAVAEFLDIQGGRERYSAVVGFDAPALYFYRVKSGDATFASSIDQSEDFQLTVYDAGSGFSDAMAGGIIYQIFVDRFARSTRFAPKVKKNALLCGDWDGGIPIYPEKPGDPVDNNDFFGCSLYGVTDKLDYLRSLGVTFIYLNPIFDAHTNHKYDTGDYMSVDSMFGGDAAFKELISEAKKRGIGVILDGVFNHTGSDSLYFNRFGNYPSVGAYNSKASPYFDWYTFREYPDKYACWWGVEILPATNKSSDSFRDFIFGENGVVRHYLKMGISGWRLDVADELPDDFLERIHDAAKSENPDGFIIGEVWEDASNKIAYDVRRKYLLGHELDSVMNYPLRSAIIDYLSYSDATALSSAVERLRAHYPKPALDSLMNLLGTHDTMRIINQLGCEPEDYEELTNAELSKTALTPEQREKGVKLLRLAYLLCASLPGVPCVYYGDERGMEGWRDPFNRLPMKWDGSDDALTGFYAEIGKIRASYPQFAHGDIRFLCDSDGLLIFSRDDLIIAVNRSDSSKLIRFKRPRKELVGGKSGCEFTLETDGCAIFE